MKNFIFFLCIMGIFIGQNSYATEVIGCGTFNQNTECSWFELEGNRFKFTLPVGVEIPIENVNYYIEGDARFFCNELNCTSISIWHCLDISFIAPCDSICELQTPGDANHNNTFDLADVVYILGYLAGTNPPPIPLANGDANGDCVIDSSDASRMMSYIQNPLNVPVDCTCLNPDTCSFQTAGDLNGDALIDNTDLDILNKFLYNNGLHPNYLANADVNGDCRIDNVDFDILESYLLGSGIQLTDCTCSSPTYNCADQMPGDFNSDGMINIPDIVYFGKYLFGLNPPPTPLANADANGDCVINIGDALHVLNFIVFSGPPPVDCTCQNPSFMSVCCWASSGNIDYDSSEIIDIADLVRLISYMFQNGAELICNEEADVDGSSSVDIADLVVLVKFMFQGGEPPMPCL